MSQLWIKRYTTRVNAASFIGGGMSTAVCMLGRRVVATKGKSDCALL